MGGKLKPDGTSTDDDEVDILAFGADEAAGNVTTKNSPKLISSTSSTNKQPSILIKQQQRSRGAGRPSLQRSNSTSFNQSMRNLRNNLSRQSSQSFR